MSKSKVDFWLSKICRNRRPLKWHEQAEVEVEVGKNKKHKPHIDTNTYSHY